ncbi:MAG TPA: 2OG-Fe(II) oxygenase, partial [Pseudomonadota bacterium]|nr:2OG-Fe(II) oxygenase [Pseudomonadota bacterium]
MLREPVGFSTNATCYVIRDAVSDSVCHRLIAEAESRGIAVTGADYPPSYRDNDRLVFDDPKLADWLFDILGTELPRELADDGGTFSLVGLNPRFRVCRYEDGQSFRIHQDGAHTVCDDVASRLTCQIYLNSADEFSGGATRFYAASSFALLGRVSPVRGTAIVFDHRLWHDGEAVPNGRKYVLRTDVLYRYTPHRRESTQDLDRADSDCIVLRGHHGYVWSVLALGPGRLASSSRDRTIRLWERAGDSWIC